MSSPLQPYHIRNLILILRRANAHYSHVAARIRATLRPTRHARRRAQHIGLSIDVAAAVKCPQKQVSNVPLPVIEVSPAPVALTRPYDPTMTAADGHLRPKTRPALKCAIPGPAILTRTSPNGTTSALSSGSVYSSIALSSAAQQHQPSAIRYPSCWFATEDEDEAKDQCYPYPRNATDPGARSVPAAPEAQWQALDVPIDEDAMDWGLDLQYPEDPEDVSGMMDISPATSASSAASGSNTDSSSSASSAGPATPGSNDMVLPLTIRVKRKSVELREDDTFEKRPRVFHNGDEAAQPQRRHVIRIPARR